MPDLIGALSYASFFLVFATAYANWKRSKIVKT